MKKTYILSYKEKKGVYNIYSTIINSINKKEAVEIFNKFDNIEKKYKIVKIKAL